MRPLELVGIWVAAAGLLLIVLVGCPGEKSGPPKVAAAPPQLSYYRLTIDGCQYIHAASENHWVAIFHWPGCTNAIHNQPLSFGPLPATP